jgi:hypothetical protein
MDYQQNSNRKMIYSFYGKVANLQEVVNQELIKTKTISEMLTQRGYLNAKQ